MAEYPDEVSRKFLERRGFRKVRTRKGPVYRKILLGRSPQTGEKVDIIKDYRYDRSLRKYTRVTD